MLEYIAIIAGQGEGRGGWIPHQAKFWTLHQGISEPAISLQKKYPKGFFSLKAKT